MRWRCSLFLCWTREWTVCDDFRSIYSCNTTMRRHSESIWELKQNICYIWSVDKRSAMAWIPEQLVLTTGSIYFVTLKKSGEMMPYQYTLVDEAPKVSDECLFRILKLNFVCLGGVRENKDTYFACWRTPISFLRIHERNVCLAIITQKICYFWNGWRQNLHPNLHSLNNIPTLKLNTQYCIVPDIEDRLTCSEIRVRVLCRLIYAHDEFGT